MAFNPLDEPGIPVAEQLRSWSELNVTPYDKREVDPYTRTRVILMNGIEVESILFSHQFHRMCDTPEIREALAMSRRVDSQQQKAVNGLNPGDQSPLETTIGYEQVAVDLTAWLARTEPDPAIRQALHFGLLEDFDHLYRYANLYDLLDSKRAEDITRSLTEITPGRPTFAEHRHPADEIRGHYATQTVDPLTRLHVLTIVAAEQQTMNYYMNHGAEFVEPIARGLYAEIAMIEEQHVTHYGSLIDPLDSWLKQLVFHEYNEVYLYWSMLTQESDERIKALWELHLNMELGQLQVAAQLLRKYEGVEAAELLPPSLPEVPITFESNIDYVRSVLADEIDLRADHTEYVPVQDLPKGHRYFEYQQRVNAGGNPTEEVIAMVREQRGTEVRDELRGDNPVADLRVPAGVSV
jgi:hypothetical protein